ncbi:MAG: TetR/AcrR family transcriptional regulator [Azonexus sp.]|jgi:AcrR family transcriptional regulator|nr:TetR/AcrR family transcriptional regulator [Azonexus sp.]
METKQTQKAKKKKKAGSAKVTHDEKRLEIIACCATLFDKVGYHGMSMQMLADEVGLGKPTLYHYFASKADILFEMHQLHLGAVNDSMDAESAKASDPGELLIKACAIALREISQHPGYVRAFMEHYGDLEPEHREQIKKRREEYLARITSIITKGMESGQFRKFDPKITTLSFLGMCNWAYKWYPRLAEQTPPEQMAAQLCEVFLEGLKLPRLKK